MKIWTFTVTIAGTGEDVDTAWCDAVDGLCADIGDAPFPDTVEEVDYE